uniref:Uncharacterized protein n=1 Tax=Rhizophagus irregularis (strain DAOM 181602 / DAOM 197198 / MUCL 43194) TaxID=747089 RepID=U9SIM0_RHIID
MGLIIVIDVLLPQKIIDPALIYDREQEAIIIKRKNSVYSSETYKKYGNAKLIKSEIKNLQIKILKNISNSPYKDNNQSTSDKINETIIQFKIDVYDLAKMRSTIQVWHQINSDDKNKSKDELPNKGKPFLEYIWTNGIPSFKGRERR